MGNPTKTVYLNVTDDDINRITDAIINETYTPEFVDRTKRVAFERAAKTETMLRDFNKLRSAIRSHDSFASEAALKNCERWISQFDVKNKYD